MPPKLTTLNSLKRLIREVYQEMHSSHEVQVLRDLIRDNVGEPPPVTSKEWIHTIIDTHSSGSQAVKSLCLWAWRELPSGTAMIESKYLPNDHQSWRSIALDLASIISNKIGQQFMDYVMERLNYVDERWRDPIEEEFLVYSPDELLQAVDTMLVNEDTALLDNFNAMFRVIFDSIIEFEQQDNLYLLTLLELTDTENTDLWQVCHHIMYHALHVNIGVSDQEIADIVKSYPPLSMKV